MARRVLMAEVSGGRVRGRPRLGWIDGVKVALKATKEWRWGLRVNARKIGMSGEPWYICNCFFWPCVLSDRPPVLWWLSPGEGWDVVGINCKNGATTENKGADVKYMG